MVIFMVKIFGVILPRTDKGGTGNGKAWGKYQKKE